jgi:hypothetical protein
VLVVLSFMGVHNVVLGAGGTNQSGDGKSLHFRDC